MFTYNIVNGTFAFLLISFCTVDICQCQCPAKISPLLIFPWTESFALSHHNDAELEGSFQYNVYKLETTQQTHRDCVTSHENRDDLWQCKKFCHPTANINATFAITKSVHYYYLSSLEILLCNATNLDRGHQPGSSVLLNYHLATDTASASFRWVSKFDLMQLCSQNYSWSSLFSRR